MRIEVIKEGFIQVTSNYTFSNTLNNIKIALFTSIQKNILLQLIK